MNLWQSVSSIANLILVLFILFYQVYKNRALIARIEQQKALIDETKSIVSHQSTAIESQGKVVDTAIKYSESFAPEKIEKIIRREFEVEKKEDIQKLKKEFADIVESKESEIKKVEALYEKAKEAENRLNKKMLSPLLKMLTYILLLAKPEERKQYLDIMEEGEAKNIVESILADLDKILAKLPEIAKEIMLDNPSIKIKDAILEAATQVSKKK